ncbi:hypothetical protein [Anaerosporobacter faecicola]|uniref:hypothetical protein n=1 Tax=Anaerosporobacter faecicola TaxID=2718714 RepID=UPI001438B9B1|nr:hypothetical protein [Anaerosporobacter faecicola]
MVDEKKKKSNALLGSIGALLGALVGIGICGVGAGFVSNFSIILGGILGLVITYGYEKLGGGLDIKGLILSAIVIAVATFIGIQLSWVISIYRQYMEAIGGASIPGIYESFFDILSICKVTARFFVNLLMAYLGAMVVLFYMHAKSQKNKDTELE